MEVGRVGIDCVAFWTCHCCVVVIGPSNKYGDENSLQARSEERRGRENRDEFPTTKGCQYPTAKGRQHYPKSHLSVSSLHSRSRNLQKGLHSGSCLPLSGCNYHPITSVVGPKLHTVIPHPYNLHTYWLDLTPQNRSGRPKNPHSQSPPFQPTSLSPPSFHHVRQKYLL